MTLALGNSAKPRLEAARERPKSFFIRTGPAASMTRRREAPQTRDRYHRELRNGPELPARPILQY